MTSPMSNRGQEAMEARVVAEETLVQVRSNWPKVTATVTYLRRVRIENNFADRLREAYKG